MKGAPPLLLASAMFGFASVSPAAVPEFSGLVSVGDQTRFVLIEPDTGASSGWLVLRDTFSGYLIKDYEAESATLILEHDGTEFRAALRKPVLLPPAPPSLSITFLPGGGLALDDTPVSLPELRQALQARGSTRDYHVRFIAYPNTNGDLVMEAMNILQKNGFRRVRIENVRLPEG